MSAPDPSSHPKDAAELPRQIPVFPLTGTLLLPWNFLPLHIFEPRYRRMLEDALAGDRIIGMIQPLESPGAGAAEDEALPTEGDSGPALYPIGCAGRIEEHRDLEGGRSLIALRGLTRFRVEEELELHRGYRRVLASYDEFPGDFDEPDDQTVAESFVEVLGRYAAARGITLDLEKLRELPKATLTSGLSMALPLAPAEKQALLEAEAEERPAMLEALLAMGAGEPPRTRDDDSGTAPLLN